MANKPKWVKTGSAGTARKQAPVNMRNEEHQYVIDGYLVDEVLDQIPSTLSILGAHISVTGPQRNSKVVIPNAARKLGVSSMYSRAAQTAGRMTFDQTSKSNIKTKVTEVCKVLGFVREKAMFKYITISNGKGVVRFNFATKEIKPDETDLRKKLKVLGATIGSGQVQSVISDLNAKKYRCTIKEEPVKFVMCYKE